MRPCCSPVLFTEWTPRRRGALSSFATSLGLHTLVVGLMWTVNPTPRATAFPEPDLNELLEHERRRVTWYAPKTEMPAVAPAEATPNPNPAERPRYQAKQDVVADNPKPLSDQQMVIGEAPEIALQQDLEIPNMISWQAPKVEMPRYQLTKPKLIAPPRPPKIEEQAPEVKPTPTQFDVSRLDDLPVLRFRREQKQAAPEPAQRRIEPAQAPEIQPQQTQTADASQFSSVARLRYQSRAEAKQAPQQRALDASGAPILRDEPGAPGLSAAVPVEDDLPRLRYQAGDRGRPQPNTPRQMALAEVGGPAPEIGENASSAAVGAIPGQDTPRLRYQGRNDQDREQSPQQRALGEAAGGPAPDVGGPVGDASAGETIAALTKESFDLPGAPAPSLGSKEGNASGGTGGDRNLVVVGVNPADKPPAEIPEGSRSGRFAAGPDGGPGGGQIGAGEQTAALRAPNLSIRGNPSPSTAATPRRQPGDRADSFRSLTRTGGFRDLTGPPPKVDYTIDAPKIDIDRPFVGRPVYTVAINMPNVTSYRGDWVIQFAEWLPPEEARKRQRDSAGDIEKRLAVKDDDLTPPWPKTKVDPKYVADAIREKVEGEVVLYGVIREDGQLRDLQVLRSLDERLDKSALAAIAQWVFEPARKDGKTVPVEVLVKIPFRLNPNVKFRY